MTTIHFLSSVTHAKCNKSLHYYILSVLAVCVDSRIHHSGHHHRRLKDTAVGRHLDRHGDSAAYVPNCGWQVFTVINCCCWISYRYPSCCCVVLFSDLFFLTCLCEKHSDSVVHPDLCHCPLAASAAISCSYCVTIVQCSAIGPALWLVQWSGTRHWTI